MTSSGPELTKLLLLQRVNIKRSQLLRLLRLGEGDHFEARENSRLASEEVFLDEVTVAARELIDGRRDSEARVREIESSIRFRIGSLVIDGIVSPRSILPQLRELLAIARRRLRGRFPFKSDATHGAEQDVSSSSDIEQVAFELHPLIRCSDPPDSLGSLRVAAILDPFSHQSFAPECDLIMLHPENWVAQLSEAAPHILLVESAWQGLDGEWSGLIQGDSSLIRSIVVSCREAGIPTVFWNKEDPLHFHAFIACAALFDYVFTSDASSIGRYKNLLGHDRVGILPFALQPQTHHPFGESANRTGSVFAGAWYGRMPDRCEDFMRVADALSMVGPLTIHDRHSRAGGPERAFPKRFTSSIRPSVPYEATGAVYRSHLLGINLNTVKQSPTMFARRAFELIGCNTSVYGNYSLGLRLLLGDLTVATDDPERLLVESWKESAAPRALLFRSRRLQALRKVLSEHTWRHRMARIAESVLGELKASGGRVWILAEPHSSEELHKVLSIRSSGRHAGVGLLLRGVEASEACTDFLDPDHPDVADDDWIVPIYSKDYYGPHYLEDMLLARAFGQGDVIGKASWFRMEDGAAIQHAPECEYMQVRMLALRRCGFKRICWRGPLSAALDQLEKGELRAERMVSIDALSYLEDGADFGAGEWDPFLLDAGLSLIDLERSSRQVRCEEDDRPGMTGAICGKQIASWLLSGDIPELVSVQVKQSDAEVCSFLEPGVQKEMLSADIPRSEIERDGRVRLSLLMPPTDQIKLFLISLGTGGRELSRTEIPRSALVDLEAHVGVRRYQIGIRVTGAIVHPIEGLRLGGGVADGIVLGSGRLLVVCNAYPEPGRFYNNAFVHRRVVAYRNLGHRVDVVVVRSGAPERSYDFDGVLVRHCSPEALARTLDHAEPLAIAVHFLDEDIWKALRAVAERVRVVVWLHGSEIQSWRHRDFVQDDGARERARRESDARTAFWIGLLRSAPSGLRLVFVSRAFAEQTWADIGITASKGIWSVIHNPIDTRLFEYQRKTPEARTRILSVRPHASKIYANDLVADVIHRLAREPIFSSLHFTLIGDGELWLENFESLRAYPNVDMQRRLVSQLELAQLHREHGVFLVPTRGDTQGVSRDEAMASGLVPITNDVGAVLEFVDNQCGMLVPAGDVEAMAQAILEVVGDPALFQALSLRASARVRAQSSVDAVVADELAVLGLASGSPGQA